MQDYLISLIYKSTKLITVIVFVSVFFALTFLIISVISNYGLSFLINTEDFTAYYTSSKMILSGEGSNLYDLSRQIAYQTQYVGNGLIFKPFINPPFVGLLFLPFSFFSLNVAYVCWFIFNLILLALIFKKIIKDFFPKEKLIILILLSLFAFFYPPVFITLISGQISFLLLIALLMARSEFIKKKKIVTGVWLSVLFLKPHYIFLPLIYFIYKKEYKVLTTFFVIGAFLMIVAFLVVGVEGIRNYFELTSSILNWQNSLTVSPALTFSLRGFLQLILGSNNFYNVFIFWINSVVFLVGFTLYLWRSKIKNNLLKLDFDWTLLIIGTILITPYTSGQDISILIIPAVLVFFWVKKIKLPKPQNELIMTYLMFGYIITVLAGFFVIYLRVHFFVIYLLSWFFIFFYIAGKNIELKNQ